MSNPNPTPLTYNGYVTQLATLAVANTVTTGGVVAGTEAAFNILIPQALNYAELRIQRELDLLPLQTSNSYTLTASTSTLSISVNDFVTIIDVIVNNVPLLPISKEFIQTVFPSGSASAQPAYFAMLGGDQATGGNTSNILLLGPIPDSNYATTIVGTQRMPTLAGFATTQQAGTSTTFISTNLPDLLLMASMIYVSGFQRNFGRQSDDPAMAMSYEQQYQLLKAGASTEELRKRFEARAWTSQAPSPVATAA